ncbi:hypothetical protein QYF36_017372 [Acer negundo]|nr:hypothetical protein QYF36_017372 [Acer negundo]
MATTKKATDDATTKMASSLEESDLTSLASTTTLPPPSIQHLGSVAVERETKVLSISAFLFYEAASIAELKKIKYFCFQSKVKTFQVS